MTSLVNIYFKHDLNNHELYKYNYTLDTISHIYEDDEFSLEAIKHYLIGFNPFHGAKEYFNYLIVVYKIEI